VTARDTTTYVVDASVATKWFVDEDDSQAARVLVYSGSILLAPDIVISEVASALTSKVRTGEFPRDGLDAALEEMVRVLLFTPSRELALAGQSLSLEFGTSFYDCLYLALAQRQASLLVTADVRFKNGMGSRFDQQIRFLDDLAV
jgi:predicted nucleic acid-binding protein